MRPNKKDIVSISQPYKWLKLLGFKRIWLSFIHINTGVCRSNLVPAAVPEIYCLIWLLNSKKLFLRTNSANLTRSLVGTFEEVCSSNLHFKAKILSLCGMLGYRPTTSAVTRKEPFRDFSYSFHFINKISRVSNV